MLFKMMMKFKKKPCLSTSNGNVVIWCFDLLPHPPPIRVYLESGLPVTTDTNVSQMNHDKVCVEDVFKRRRRIETLNFLLTGKIQLIVAKYILLNVGTDLSNILYI